MTRLDQAKSGRLELANRSAEISERLHTSVFDILGLDISRTEISTFGIGEEPGDITAAADDTSRAGFYDPGAGSWSARRTRS